MINMHERTHFSHQLSVAPMLDWTHRHCRYLHRILAPHAFLYTEMVTTGAILYGDRAAHLDFDAAELPLALQLGGSNATDLAHCAEIAQTYGYSEVNLNCGCPSPRVQKGAFGACLMQEPDKVAQAVHAMRQACDLPITIKHRIGIDRIQDDAFMQNFVATTAAQGCTLYIVHARNAWLDGLSPKQNRDIPPLCYDKVYRLKQTYPHLSIVINGGIDDISASEHLMHVDGVMLGRAAYHQPYSLHELSHAWWQTPLLSRTEIVQKMIPYAQTMVEKGVYLGNITQAMLGLWHGQTNGRIWRQYLSDAKKLKMVKHAQDVLDFFAQALAVVG